MGPGHDGHEGDEFWGCVDVGGLNPLFPSPCFESAQIRVLRVLRVHLERGTGLSRFCNFLLSRPSTKYSCPKDPVRVHLGPWRYKTPAAGLITPQKRHVAHKQGGEVRAGPGTRSRNRSRDPCRASAFQTHSAHKALLSPSDNHSHSQ